MGFVAASGSNPDFGEDQPASLRDRRLRSQQPTDLLSGPAAAKAIAQAQAYLAVGAAIIGTLAVALPHPPYFNVIGLLCVQAVSAVCGVIVWLRAGRNSFAILRMGPVLATVNTTAAVY